MLQAKSHIFVARFIISSKNRFRYRLNHPNWRRLNFKQSVFHKYFGFSGPIRKCTHLGKVVGVLNPENQFMTLT
jgi:hypothetical protein